MYITGAFLCINSKFGINHCLHVLDVCLLPLIDITKDIIAVFHVVNQVQFIR